MILLGMLRLLCMVVSVEEKVFYVFILLIVYVVVGFCIVCYYKVI